MHICCMDAHAVYGDNGGMPRLSPSAERMDEIAARVRLLRSVIASSQVELCHRLEIRTNTWSHYEKGRSPPSDPVIAKLKALHGVTRDWIMDGSWSGMPVDLAERLQKAEAPKMRANQKRLSA